VRAAALGLAYGTAWLGAGVWWLFISLHRYGHLSAWFAALAVAVLALALSSYLALAMAAVARWRCGRPWPDAVLFAAAWLTAEWARTWLFTGFPWVTSGYAHVDSPLAALAPWVGVLGIGAAAAGLAALLPAVRHRRGAAVLVIAALAVPALTGPARFSQPGGTLSVSLLQTNVAQDEKFAAERLPAALAWLAGTLAEARGQLLLAPETAIPLLPGQLKDLAPDYWPGLVERFGRTGQAALIGVPLGDYETGYSNSVVGLGAAPSAAPYRYDKQHLVPFGEFIPTGFRWFTTLMNIPLGDFMRGARNPPSFVFRGERIAPNICYEDLFGEELAQRFADAPTAPTAFANLSNIGWFGDTIAVQQHLNISRMRALEFQRPMLRATNTGATAIIDHEGRVTASMAPFTRGVLDGVVQGRLGITPFAWWTARAGLWPMVLLALAVLAFSAVRSARAGPAFRR
jgi:apolipoprotein N-acyltransferase